MCFGFCEEDMDTNTSWQPSQNDGGFIQQQEIGGGLSTSVTTQPNFGDGFVQHQEIQSGGGISSVITSNNGFGDGLSTQMTPNSNQLGQTTWNQNS